MQVVRTHFRRRKPKRGLRVKSPHVTKRIVKIREQRDYSLDFIIQVLSQTQKFKEEMKEVIEKSFKLFE